MGQILPILLLGVAGLLVGGAISLRRQGSGWLPVILVSFLALLAFAAGILWMGE
jgi:hypothetical protein